MLPIYGAAYTRVFTVDHVDVSFRREFNTNICFSYSVKCMERATFENSSHSEAL